jgi:predicted DNA-binding transcriptional regulator
MDFKMRDCNYRGGKVVGTWQYRSVCRVLIIIFNITCKITNMIYIGNMQQHFKMRMRGHFQDVKRLMEKGVLLDTFAESGLLGEQLHQCQACSMAHKVQDHVARQKKT